MTAAEPTGADRTPTGPTSDGPTRARTTRTDTTRDGTTSAETTRTGPAVADDPVPARHRFDPRRASWWPMLRHVLPVYVVSRLCVLAGAAVVAAELRVDANIGADLGVEIPDPHGGTTSGSAGCT